MKNLFLFTAIAVTGILLFSACRKSTPTAPSDPADSLFSVTVLTAPEPGQIFIALNGNNNGTLMVLDEQGHILKKKDLGPQVDNFQRWVVNGQVQYTYAHTDPNAYQLPGVNNIQGYEVICDSNFNEIKRVTLGSYKTISNSPQGAIDGHDFILIDDNHYIVETYYEQTVNNIPDSLTKVSNVKVVAPVIQEIENDNVVWQWSATNYPEFYSTSVEGNGFSDSTTIWDYMHINSMYIDPRDNNLICSFRNLNQILKINRTTGAIMWRLGGKNSDFPMTSDQVFLRQHCVTLTDNNQTLLVFDDGEATERPSTRIVEFNLNETTHTINSFKAFPLPEPFTAFTGSVQKRGDTYFIGGGTAAYTLEINYNTGEKLFKLKQKENSYRAFKY